MGTGALSPDFCKFTSVLPACHCVRRDNYLARVARHLLRKKAKPYPKKAKRGKKSQIVKNHEISAFSMCYHAFSKVVDKANSTVTDYAHGNLKFIQFLCITFAA